MSHRVLRRLISIPNLMKEKSMRRSASYVFSIWLLLSALMAFGYAQSPVGTISGTVTDQAGAVIHDASIIIRNKATSVERQSKSESDGTYSATALPAGEYEVKVQMQGFRTLLREVTVNAGTVTKIDVSMEVGQPTEIVTIEA